MDRDTRRRLRDADWEDIGIRLTAYATWKARNYRWRTGQSWALAAGKTPEDLAREAIVKALDGTRAWDPARGALLPFLQGVVDSLMSHLAASGDNVLLGPWQASLSNSAVQEDDSADLVGHLRQALAERGDIDLLAVLDAVQAHGPKPHAIAAGLGTTVADINNRLKRIRRAALKIRIAAGARMRA
jgi:DNA-directed RNA polymerase specialized sigma24 family protein